MLLLTSSNNPPLTSPLPLNKSGNMEPVNHSFQRREHTANATYKAGHIKTNPDPGGTKRAHGHPSLGGALISVTSQETWRLLLQWRHSQGTCQVERRCLLATACMWALNFSTCLDFIGTYQTFEPASHLDEAESGLPLVSTASLL